MTAVQQSCLTTLSGLVSVLNAQTLPSSLTDSWSRTDMPAALVHTLRARDGTLDVPQSQSIDSQGQGSADETALLDQLHDLVDAHLAQAIVALLSDLQMLFSLLSWIWRLASRLTEQHLAMILRLGMIKVLDSNLAHTLVGIAPSRSVLTRRSFPRNRKSCRTQQMPSLVSMSTSPQWTRSTLITRAISPLVSRLLLSRGSLS